ncbi:MAG: NAD(P)-dependent glycerol-3-phosphate dehydrogenase [Coriobacteriia bacterium]|nr:NAD(P)-dependent glycerol-3-phosphate dehydrogenase [Coriobacteriia bacterium]
MVVSSGAQAQIGVIGAGSWGSAIAWLLGEQGRHVRFWTHGADLAEAINTQHQNPRFLAQTRFAQTVVASADLAEVVSGAESLVMVTPSSAVSEIAQKIAPLLAATTPVVLLSKGLDFTSDRLLLEILAERFGHPERLAVLSGPNHAEEVSRGIPSGTVVASSDADCADYFQRLFATPNFRVYTSDDTVGVQLCGAAKNVMAIACGLTVGLGYGDNTLAMIMTRGLAEISRLVIACGGQQQTCMGLAGMGDLVVTCTSVHSRNRAFGLELAQGGSLEDYQSRTQMVVEGALACRTVSALAQQKGVEMPLCELVRAVVWGGGNLDKEIAALFQRRLKAEYES